MDNSAETMQNLLKWVKVIKATGAKNGLMYFFHGSGDTGKGIYEWVNHVSKNGFNFSHLDIVFPTAPVRPYRLYGNELSHVWFDRSSLSPTAPEDFKSIHEICTNLSTLIKEDCQKNQIPLNRVILGGFSMGGALALHLGYRFLPQSAGIFTLSSFLNNGSKVYETITSDQLKIPLLMCHGDQDSLVLEKWGRDSFDSLKKIGIPGEYHTIPGAEHELTEKEMHILKNWILKILPEK